MNEVDIAYTAGLMDGEGTITLSRNKPNEWRSPVVSMSSTTPALLQFMLDNFGGSASKQTRAAEHHMQAWSWKIIGNRALAFCEQFQHHLREPKKRARAQHLAENYAKVTVRNGRYRPDQIAAKQAFEELFFTL